MTTGCWTGATPGTREPAGAEARSDLHPYVSTCDTQEGGNGWTCQRALTVRNNVAVDIATCGFSQSGSPAKDIAIQIAAKVNSQ
jgi:hypothetical protein